MEKYESSVYEKASISRETSIKEKRLDTIGQQLEYSKMTLVGEVARLLGPEVSCLTIEGLIEKSEEGFEGVLKHVNTHNELIYDVVAPAIFSHLYEVESKQVVEEREVSLLRAPKNSEYYEFSALPELVAMESDSAYEGVSEKSFHADTYCFDSKPERELFNQLIYSDDVEEIYFTGMFTGGQSDLAIQYIDPESYRIRSYYPDFYIKAPDGSVELVEVKGDNKIDDATVQAKASAAREIAHASSYEYRMITGSFIVENDLTEMSLDEAQRQSIASASVDYAFPDIDFEFGTEE